MEETLLAKHRALGLAAVDKASPFGLWAEGEHVKTDPRNAYSQDTAKQYCGFRAHCLRLIQSFRGAATWSKEE